jgi:ABC-type transport system substrate-binding protein
MNSSVNSIISRLAKTQTADVGTKDAAAIMTQVFKANGIAVKARSSETNSTEISFEYQDPLSSRKEVFSVSLEGKKIIFDGKGSPIFNGSAAEYLQGDASLQNLEFVKLTDYRSFNKWESRIANFADDLTSEVAKMKTFAENFSNAIGELQDTMSQNKFEKKEARGK